MSETVNKISVEESKQIAGTILEQLGGRQFIAMTGAHNFVCDGYSCSMNLRRNAVGAKWLKITLNAMDTYDMEFISMNPKTFEMKVKAERKGVYDEMLQSVFTEVTGLYTSLGTMGR